uniref:Uncharacterized protein LOC100180654 n=1 Tax=Phallusia mammillata TaxID=59560 RepID=A0A6F9DI09_9ASCI|nr:uncharacterized protein LOC100180654 [Phallusia mammillata]
MSTSSNPNENWSGLFSELNLQNKVTGDCIIDWSNDHNIAIATNHKIVVCSIAQFGKSPEFDYTISTVSLPESENKKTLKKMLDYENLCAQSSNVLAYPDFDIYQLQLDSKFSTDKQATNNGFGKLKFLNFSPVEKPILVATTLDQRLLLYNFVSTALKGQWRLSTNLSHWLDTYYESNKTVLSKILEVTSCTEQEVISSSAISCFDWSRVLKCGSQRYCYLFGATSNGLIIIWKLNLPARNADDFDLVHISNGKCSDVCAIACDKSKTRHSKSIIKTVMSTYEGTVICSEFHINEEGDFSNTRSVSLWNEKDYLFCKNLQWFCTGEEKKCFVFGTKGSHIIVWEIGDDFKIKQETTQNTNGSSILNLKICNKVRNSVYTCNENGNVNKFTCSYHPKLMLFLDETLCQADDACYRNFAPVTYHGITVSPNGAFLAIVKSFPKVCRSVQIDNTAFLSMQRLMKPEKASQILHQLTVVNTNVDMFKYFDLFEIIRQHYFLTEEFCPVLKEFLSLPVSKTDTVGSLHLRWYLLKAKEGLEKQTNIMDSDKKCTEQLKQVELMLTTRQMIKVIECWLNADEPVTPQSCYIVPIITWLESHQSLIPAVQQLTINQAKYDETYSQLPKTHICYYTSQPIKISEDARFGISPDGSRWPICSLTFNVLQKPAKRSCLLSGLYADTEVGSSWTNSLLQAPCIFSHAPYT